MYRCGHCKKLEPIYKKLAKQMNDDNTSIVKYDGTANDLPEGVDVRGFPTLIYYPRYKKHDPQVYEGDRSLKALKVRICTHLVVLFCSFIM